MSAIYDFNMIWTATGFSIAREDDFGVDPTVVSPAAISITAAPAEANTAANARTRNGAVKDGLIPPNGNRWKQ